MQKRREWTDAEIERLLCLKKDGKTYEEIALILGRSKSAIDGKFSHLKQLGKRVTSTWSQGEIELLIALAETLPRTKLLAAYNQAAVKNNYPKRTMGSICSKLLQLGQSLKPQSGWYGIPAIAIGLGFSRSKIHTWLKAGLKYHAEGEKNFYVRNDELIKFILAHPESMMGLSEDGLQWFLALLLEEKEMRKRDGRPEYARSLVQ